MVAATAAALDAARQPVEPSPATDRSARELARALRPVLPAGAYGLEWLDVRSFSAVSIGTAANLTRHGYDIDFPADHAGRVGEFRARGRTDRPLVVIVGQTPSRLWPPPPPRPRRGRRPPPDRSARRGCGGAGADRRGAGVPRRWRTPPPATSSAGRRR